MKKIYILKKKYKLSTKAKLVEKQNNLKSNMTTCKLITKTDANALGKNYYYYLSHSF